MDFIRSIVLVLVMVAGSTLQAESIDQVLSCMTSSDSKGLVRCKMKALVFFPQQAYESTFKINYTFNCKGGKIDGLGILASDTGNFSRFSFGDSGSIEVTGVGPFKLHDEDPEWTRFVHLDLQCKLSLGSIDIRPSPATIANWGARQIALHNEISNAEISAAGYSELRTLGQVLIALNLALYGLSGDLNENQATHNRILDTLRCPGVQSLEDCSLIQTLIFSASSALALPEKQALMKLSNIILDLGSTKVVSLESVLSAKTYEILQGILNKKDAASQAEKHFTHFQDLIVERKRELATLRSLSADYIPWSEE